VDTAVGYPVLYLLLKKLQISITEAADRNVRPPL
jgi:hypothetical protein